jgi:hypothetical protein
VYTLQYKVLHQTGPTFISKAKKAYKITNILQPKQEWSTDDIYIKKKLLIYEANLLLLGYINQNEYNQPNVVDKLRKQERDNNPLGSLTKWWDNTKLHQIKWLQMYAKA